MGKSFRYFAEAINDADLFLLSDRAFRFWVSMKCCEVIFDGCLPGDDELAWYCRLKPRAFEVRAAELIQAGLAERGTDGRLALLSREYESYRLPAAEWALLRSQVFERDDYTCTYCSDRGGRLECDHKVPLARGGSNDLENLTTACFACNRSKHSKLLKDWKPNGSYQNN